MERKTSDWTLEGVNSFIYLGSIENEDEGTKEDIKTSINKT